MKTPEELYDDIETRYPGRSVSRSERLWELQLEQYIDPGNRSTETILEKSVAMLAQKNICPDISINVQSLRGFSDRIL